MKKILSLLHGPHGSDFSYGKRSSAIASLFCCLLFVFANFAYSQTVANEWTWMGGSSSTNQPGVYGILGTPAATNAPGARYGAANWTDNDGNLWLFGGIGYDASGNLDELNDLWKFDPSTNEWTWMAGSSNVVWANDHRAVYGTLGTPASGNIPGGRNSAVSWTDSNGDFWLFGGRGFDGNGVSGYLNDLWKFDPSTNEWTWMSGSSTFGSTAARPGVYGTLGTPSDENVPGAREGAASWIDSSGNLWLLGGYGYDANDNLFLLNDLWRFDPSTNQWTWMSGSSTLAPGNPMQGRPGVYGVKGTPAATNVPGSRYVATSWTDGNGNLWLFGGHAIDANNVESPLNDLWVFRPSTGLWTWMNGSSAALTYTGNIPIYGVLGTPDENNTPGGHEDASGWTDSEGNFWLFGGDGNIVDSSRQLFAYLNELWKFNPSTNQWTCMGRSDAALQNGIEMGVYGTLGVSAANNIPIGRGTAANWIDSGGNFWLIGGYYPTYNSNGAFFNDLWEYQPYAITSTPTFSPAAGAYIAAQTVTISDATPDAVIYYTTDGTKPTTNSSVYSSAITVSSSEKLKAIAIASGYPASAIKAAAYVIAEPTPTPTFSVAAGTYITDQTVTISDATAGAIIYYTIDGSTPTTSSTVYSGPITISSSQTLEAIAIANGYTSSAVASAVYTITPPAATPTFSVAAGTYTSAQTVMISDATAGATIYYTIDGSTPTTSSTVYSGPITISSSQTLEAIAIANGYTSSAVASAVYTITPPAATPTFSVAAGTYTSAQTVTISDATAGATIYYTTDGTAPTTSSIPYTGAITVTSTETINAIAVASGYTTSAVASAGYIIQNPAPTIENTSPSSTTASGTAFELTVNGSGFTYGSTINWGTTALATTYVSASKLVAVVSAAEIASAGTTAVTVQTPTPGGGTSNSWQFQVDSASGATIGPSFSSTAATVTAGSPASYPVTLPSTVSNVSVTCLNLPTGATCSYSSTTKTVTIATSASTPAGTYLVTMVFAQTVTTTTTAWIFLPFLLLPFMMLRKELTARGLWITAGLGVVLLTATMFSTGCGGGGGGASAPTTTTTTSQVTSSKPVSLTVQ
jgi:N-acetylneuraminic acid mutarotase